MLSVTGRDTVTKFNSGPNVAVTVSVRKLRPPVPHDLSTSAGVQRLLDDLGPGQSAVRIPTDSPVAMAHCRRAIGAALLNFSAHAGDRPSFPRPRIASSLAPGRTSATPHSGSTAAILNGTPSA